MTLYDFLRDKELDHLGLAFKYFKNDKEFNRHMGASNACVDLIDTLSDETLRMKVKTRSEAIMKGESK